MLNLWVNILNNKHMRTPREIIIAHLRTLGLQPKISFATTLCVLNCTRLCSRCPSSFLARKNIIFIHVSKEVKIMDLLSRSLHSPHFIAKVQWNAPAKFNSAPVVNLLYSLPALSPAVALMLFQQRITVSHIILSRRDPTRR